MAIEITPPKRDPVRAGQRRRSLDALWRLGGWGGAATLALVLLAFTVQTDVARTRLQAMFDTATAPARVAEVAAIPKPAPEKDSATRALEAELRMLTADRERLAARMASLERHLDDVTGSIQRQAAAPPPPAATPAPAAAPAPTATPAPAATPAAPPASQPAMKQTSAEPATRVATAPAAPPPPIIDPLALPVVADTATGWPGAGDQQAALTEPPEPATAEAEAEAAEPPEPMEQQTAVPLPPARYIAPAAVPPLLPRSEYGIDLGGATNMGVLRNRWSVIKANHGPLLVGLQPIAVRDPRPGSNEYRLIAGPLPNYATARSLCLRFTGTRATCRPAKFDPDQVVQR
jgi:hypothetical protein